jgi:hypothetical protein
VFSGEEAIVGKLDILKGVWKKEVGAYRKRPRQRVWNCHFGTESKDETKQFVKTGIAVKISVMTANFPFRVVPIRRE